MDIVDLSVSPATLGAIDALLRWPLLGLHGLAPSILSIQGADRPAVDGWRGSLGEGPVEVVWDLPVATLEVDLAGPARLWAMVEEIRETQFLDLCRDLSAELVVLGPLSPTWLRRPWRDRCVRRGLALGHTRPGSALAFRGAGHDRLVSRRWLDHGPWLVVRDESTDLSVVFLHDWTADSRTAFDQASAAWRWLGGWIPVGHPRGHDLVGRLRSDGILEIRVGGRDVPESRMIDAASLKLDNPRIDDVCFVFDHRRGAEAHAHALWLRGLGCAVATEGGPYELLRMEAPLLSPPAWVQRVRRRLAPVRAAAC